MSEKLKIYKFKIIADVNNNKIGVPLFYFISF